VNNTNNILKHKNFLDNRVSSLSSTGIVLRLRHHRHGTLPRSRARLWGNSRLFEPDQHAAVVWHAQVERVGVLAALLLREEALYFECRINKNALLHTFIWRFCPLGGGSSYEI